MTPKHTRFILTVLMLGLVMQPALGATLYVSPQGRDGNPGTATAPFANPYKAVSVVKPGDTVIVREGVYTATDSSGRVVNLVNDGSEGKWITLRADTGAHVVLDGANSKDYVVNITDSTYIRIEGFEIKGGKKSGISVNNSNNIAIAGNEVHHNGNRKVLDCQDTFGRNGILIQASSAYIVVDRNAIHHNGRIPNANCDALLGMKKTNSYGFDHGIYAQGSRLLIQNNLFWSQDAGNHIKIDGFYGKNLGPAEYSHVITNNSFGRLTRPDGRGGVIGVWNNATYSSAYGYKMKNPRFLLQNNVFHEPGTGVAPNDTAVRFHPEWNKVFTGHVVRNNLTTSKFMYNEDLGSAVTNNIKASGNLVRTDPRIENTSPYSFRLKGDSSAIGSGLSENSPTYDYENAVRRSGAIDMGAYAYSGTAGSLTPAPEGPLLAPQGLEVSSQ